MSQRLIINADDFGLCSSVNKAIIDVYKAGNLTSTTLMVNMPGTEEAAELSKENPGLGIGLHFCLTEGRPLTKAFSIVDANGIFLDRSTLIKKVLNGKVNAEDIQLEFKAQLDKAQELGVSLTHADSHQHIHMLPFVFKAMQGELEKRGLPMRIVQPPQSLDFGLIFSKPKKAAKQFVNYTIGKKIRKGFKGKSNLTLVSIHEFDGDLNVQNEQIYTSVMETAKSNDWIELMVHPYILDESLKALYPNNFNEKEAFIKKCLLEYKWLTQPNLFENYQLVKFSDL